MATASSRELFLKNLHDSGLLSQQEIDTILNAQPALARADGNALAEALVAAGKMTYFQAAALREGRFEELTIGNYHVLDRLGAGGMGTVFKARHRRMKRVVAIKVLSRNMDVSEEFVQRFQREVEAVARLSHPNIVLAHDADESKMGPFLVMEFVDGRDLASEVHERGPLSVKDAGDCVLQAARALDYAHRQGIIHRDVKPANLLRDSHGVVKLADLGLARFNDTLEGASSGRGALTQAGTVMGTVDFMPPEQAMDLRKTDHRADIYSLGCTLHYLLIGRPPYEGESIMGTLLQHRDAAIPSLCAARSEVPAALDRIFQRMVAKRADDRHPTMAEVVTELEALSFTPGSRPSAAVPSVTVDFGSVLLGPSVAMDAPTIPPALALLLVEPSRSQAVIIRTFLQKLGYTDVPTAPSGAKALEMVRSAPPGVVLSAMHLPDMTGVQLAQKLLTGAPLSPIGFVLITSQSDPVMANFQGQTGSLVLLHKPFGQEELEQALNAARKPPATLDRLRVLLVDDSAAARVHVRAVLAGLGVVQIVETADGAEAVAALEVGTFDVVVTDYNMPRLDGRGLIEFIRRRSATPSVPVILVTTETDPGKLEAVRRLGVSAICDKSFRSEVVRGILEKLG